MHASDALREADRLMTICNACRYCEGVCAVFPAMERRRTFADGDLTFLANLCHGCGACLDDCQFAPPHAFAVDVPRTLATVRAESYADYGWPRALAPVFRRNGLAIALATAASVAGFLIGLAAWNDPRALFRAEHGPGAFYRLMPHGVMATLFGAVFLYALIAIAMSVRSFMRDALAASPRARPGIAALRQAMADAARLRYLDGGGGDCPPDTPSHRRLFHHLAFYGFVLCLASTATATLYHYVFAREAPYPWYDLPVLLGIAGGIGLVVGAAGLFAEGRREGLRARRDGMDIAFTALLVLTGATGLLLLALRATPAMGTLLAIHLGVVFAFFLAMPYGKFVHGFFRFAALACHAAEQAARDRPDENHHGQASKGRGA